MAEGNAERKEVEDYLKKHDLQNVLNTIINNIIKSRAEEPLEAIAKSLMDRDERGILSLVARETLDSAGHPTVCIDVTTARGTFTASVPPLPPTEFAAVELRDLDKTRFAGGGVTMAVKQINEVIAPALINMDPADQTSIDDKLNALDGTPDKSRLGANSLLAVSIAVCRAGAAARKTPLYKHIASLAGFDEVCMPVPAFTVVEGGSSAPDGQNPWKEYNIMPTSAETFSEALRIGVEVHAAIKTTVDGKLDEGETPPELLKGKQGGWSLEQDEYEEVLGVISEAVEACGYEDRVRYAINLDGNSLAVKPAEGEEVDEDDEQKYDLGWKASDGSKITEAEEFSKTLGELIEKYPIVSMEDPFCNTDVGTYSEFTATLGEDLQVVGNALLGSSTKRVRECEPKALINAITLKPICIGTVSEAVALAKQAQKLNWGIVVESMPVGTADDFDADLAVGLRAGQIKCGAPTGADRNAKYNRLLKIEDELGESAMYVGNQFRRPPAP